MPRPGYRWRLVTISTKRSWLPGDPRGWRSRNHKRHSSGDYKHRPPAGEHQHLHEYFKQRVGERVELPIHLRAVVGQSMIVALREMGFELLAIAVTDWHVHLLVELPDDLSGMRRIIGQMKRKSSRVIKAELPGQVWASGGDFEPVDEVGHQRNAYKYVLHKQGPKAWAWSYKPGVVREPTE